MCPCMTCRRTATGETPAVLHQYLQACLCCCRKDAARECARARRTTEADLFQQLSALLGLSSMCGRQDKSSVIRLATTAVKAQGIIKQVVAAGAGTTTDRDKVQVDQADMVGCIMIITKEMEVITVTDNIYTMLGINTVDMLGNNLCDFIHPCDHSTLKSVFSQGDDHQQAAVRVKNLLQGNGRVVSMRQAGYEVHTPLHLC